MSLFVKYTSWQEQLKGEDMVIVHENLEKLSDSPDDMCNWGLYCVCDGHGGSAAVKYMEENLGKAVVKRLPSGSPPDCSSPDWDKTWGKKIRQAVVDAFLYLDDDFEKQGYVQSVGCTVCMALVCGRLLTVANIGDSEAFLDAGQKCILEMTNSHKIDTNVDEQNRLKAAGKAIKQLGRDLIRPADDGLEGIGPLRVWPCGLAVSRSLGDYDCGPEVTAAPHIRQVELPATGTRLVLASDGLWDHLTSLQACKLSRKKKLDDVATALVQLAETVSSEGHLTDDTSVLVVDMLANANDDFKSVAKRQRRPRNLIRRFFWRPSPKYLGEPRFLADYDGVNRIQSSDGVTMLDNDDDSDGSDEESEDSAGKSTKFNPVAASSLEALANRSRVLKTDNLENGKTI